MPSPISGAGRLIQNLGQNLDRAADAFDNPFSYSVPR